MLSDTLKGKLAQDITTEERWDEILEEINGEGYNVDRPANQAPFGHLVVKEWFHMREKARTQFGVYRSTGVLDRINQMLPGYFIHVKEGHEDKQMVAYTSSGEDARKDKKHLVRLGRLLTKLCPLFTATFINELCAEHVQEADPTLEILFGLEGIKEAYYDGPAACMSKSTKEYSTEDAQGNKHLPIEVYDMPHIGVAVTRNIEGKVNSRALVLPEDKIFIRAYGSPVLVKKLEMNGYKAGSFVGKELKRIPLKSEKTTAFQGSEVKLHTVLCPYIDGHGTSGGSDRSTVALIDGKLMVISSELQARLVARYGVRSALYHCATNTNGAASLIELNSEDFALKDGITGESLTDEEARKLVSICYKGAVVQSRLLTWYALTDGPYVSARHHTGRDIVQVNARRDECIYYDGRWWVPSTEMYTHYGLVKLDERYYPGGGVVRSRSAEHVQVGKLSEDATVRKYIKKADARCILYVDGDGDTQTYYEHDSEPTKGRGLVKLHRLRGWPDVWAEPGVTIHKTDTGRKVVEDVHNIVKLWNDVWTLRKPSVQQVNLFGNYFSYDGEVPAELVVGGSVWLKAFKERIAEYDNVTGTAGTAFINFTKLIENLGATYVHGEHVSSWSGAYSNGIRRMLQTRNLPEDTPISTARKLFVEDMLAAAMTSMSPHNSGAFSYEEAREKMKPALYLAYDWFVSKHYQEADAAAVDYNAPVDTFMAYVEMPTPVQEEAPEPLIIG